MYGNSYEVQSFLIKESDSGVPQAPIMSFIYVYDIAELLNSYTNIFADYTQLLKKKL